MSKEIILQDIERRYFQGGMIEKRASKDSRTVEGYAFKYGVLSRDLGGFFEKIDPGFLDGVDLTDVVALFNHDNNLILARTSSGTLKLTNDSTGLHYSFDAPETTAGNDLLISIDRGDVQGSSFAFRTLDDDWEMVGDIVVRTLKKCRELIDVSPVVFPAYPSTDVGKRSMDAWKTKQNKPEAFKNLELSKAKLELLKM